MKQRRNRAARIAAPATETAVALTAPAVLSGYLTPAQLADELGVCERTVHRWHALRTGPARTKFGNKVYYRRSAVQAWLQKREEDPDALSTIRRRA